MLHLDRNYYDRLGHFAQGFVPAMIAREVLLRRTALRREAAELSDFQLLHGDRAMYDLFEFAADAFLGSQGDVWDTQGDMTWCLIGSICSLIGMRGLHDRALSKLKLRIDKLPY